VALHNSTIMNMINGLTCLRVSMCSLGIVHWTPSLIIIFVQKRASSAKKVIFSHEDATKNRFNERRQASILNCVCVPSLSTDCLFLHVASSSDRGSFLINSLSHQNGLKNNR